MCIAILTKPGKVLNADVFKRCWMFNRNGFGMAFVNGIDGNVEIDKGWMTVDNALRQYHRIAEDRKCADRPMLLHFRAATVGGINEENCHPFKVKGGAMIHNGTFWHDALSAKSDSRILAEMMHNELHYANLVGHKEAFDKAFGYNRVAFLFKEGKYVIISEKYSGGTGQFGQWKDDIWYSNGGWKGQYNGNYGDDAAVNPTPPAADEDDYRRWLGGERRQSRQHYG